jgi:hypothetical protein
VENIKAKNEDVIYDLQKQLTYLKLVDETVSQNAIELATIARTLKWVITTAFSLQDDWSSAFHHLQDLIFFQANTHAQCASWNSLYCNCNSL